MVGQRRRQRQCSRGATDCRRPAGEHAEQALKAQGLGRDHGHADGHYHQNHHQRNWPPAQRHHLLEGDAHAQQRHADAQHRACSELDAGLAGAVIGEKIQGHAQ
ncbi:hypothetical protein D3C78_1027860 [compost metagenome]